MHPTPSAPPKRALRGLGGLLLGSLLLLGPVQVSAEHDLTCHPKPPESSFEVLSFELGAESDAPGLLVIPATPLDDRTGTAPRPVRHITIDEEKGTTTMWLTFAVAPGEARSC
jgi:hypothetical protein